jgi:TIR domain
VRVFVSYRRGDVGGYAGRLSDALVARLGHENVFQDVSAIGAGRDFTVEIDTALASSDAVLAVIGPGWLSAATPDGRLRLFQPDDFVRRELVQALGTTIPVVPVLVGGATLPSASELPKELAELARRQAVDIRDEAFHSDVDLLLQLLRGERPATPRPRGRLLAAGVAILAAVGGTAAWLVLNQPDDGNSGELTGCPNPAEGDWNSITLNGTPSAEVDDTDGTVLISVNDANWRALDQGGWEIVLTTAMKNRNSINRQHTQDYYANIVVAERPFDPTCFDTPREEYTAPEQVADGHVGFAVSCPPDGSMDLELKAQPSGDRTPLRLTAATTPGDCLTDSP